MLPAEWEPQSSIQLTWPHEETDWRPYLKEINHTFVEMVEAITRFESVVIAARSVTDVPLRVREMERVSIFECPIKVAAYHIARTVEYKTIGKKLI